MEREIIKPMKIQKIKEKSKALNQESSFLCKKLFPDHFKPPTQGELQNIILLVKTNGGGEKEMFKTGLWWLWARDLFIENTITQEEKRNLIKIGVTASLGIDNITIISARSPELLHSKVSGQGDPTLPRSVIAMQKIQSIVEKSNHLLPTKAVLVFADLAIDNFVNIEAVCDVEKTIQENIFLLKKIAEKLNFNSLEIIRMSELINPRLGMLGGSIHKNGTPFEVVGISPRAENLINTSANESFESHSFMFGWNKETSFTHSKNLAITMGLVGESLKNMFPNGTIIHNEAFISRGRLNNIFTDPKDPIPVICLNDLLEKKKPKG
jgi:hypothetical protein